VQPPLITPPPSLVYITKEQFGFQEAALENGFRERSERNWFRERFFFFLNQLQLLLLCMHSGDYDFQFSSLLKYKFI
jgi:hypothetical protein